MNPTHMKKLKIIAASITIALLIFLASIKIGFMMAEGNLYDIVKNAKGIITAIGILIISVYGFGIVIGALTLLLALISLPFGLTTIPNILSFIRTLKIFLTSVIIGVLISVGCPAVVVTFLEIIFSIVEYIFDIDITPNDSEEEATQDESGDMSIEVGLIVMAMMTSIFIIAIIAIKKTYGLLEGHKYMWHGFKQNRKKFLKMFVEFSIIYLYGFLFMWLLSWLLPHKP